MNAVTEPAAFACGEDIFPLDSRTRFAAAYPEQPLVIEHDLHDHPLLRLDALAELVELGGGELRHRISRGSKRNGE